MKLPYLPQSRNDLPLLFNTLLLRGVGVEVGTDRGEYAEHLRRYWQGEKLVCVDPWGAYCGQTPDERERAYEETWHRLAEFPEGSWRTLRMKSVEAATAIAESVSTLLDFVYLDGDHSYSGVMSDIEAWWPLIRSGGVLCGHDWVADGWRHFGDGPQESFAYGREDYLERPGWPCYVRLAVKKFFGDVGLYVTSPETDGGWQSWIVVKP